MRLISPMNMPARRAFCAASAALALMLGGCTSIEVRSADLVRATQRLCIQQNPQVPAQFLGVLQQAIAANGLAADVFAQGQQPADCRYVVTYAATRSDASFAIVRDGEAVAVGKYHVRGTRVAFAKPESLKAQVDPVIDQLLAIYKRNGAPPKATAQGLAPTTFEPVAESRTQLDALPGRNATDFVPVARKPSLAGTVPATLPPADATATAPVQHPQPQAAPVQPVRAPAIATQPAPQAMPQVVAPVVVAAPQTVPVQQAPPPLVQSAPQAQQSMEQYAQQVYAQPQPAQTAALNSPQARPTAVVPAQATSAASAANGTGDDGKRIAYTDSPEGAARSIAAIRNCMVRFTQLQQYNGRTVYSSVCWGDKRLLISCEAGVCREMR